MTNQEIKTVGQTIAAETQIGGNTAERVGGVIEGIGEALDNKDAAVGYYLATMSGSTIYINASSYRLGTGGNLRAKMPAAATTACTLTVGNANAVPLWYNGAAVSADNSWEAGEIVTIFYDGTRFMASNSQGGGGQFGSGEKIKDILLSQALGDGTGTITSQKGVSDAIFNEIDISSIDSLKTLNDALAPSSSLKPTYYTVTATLSNVKLKVGSMAVISDNMRHVVTEIMATHYTLDDTGTLTNEHSDAEIFFIYRSVKLSGGTLPDPAGTWIKWRYVNSSVWSTVAEKIKYDNTTSGLAADNVQEALDEVSLSIGDKAVNNKLDLSAQSILTNWVAADGTPNTAGGSHFVAELDGYEYVRITASSKDTYYTWATAVQGYVWTPLSSSRYQVTANTTKDIPIPSGAKYLIVGIATRSDDYTPSAVSLMGSVKPLEDMVELMADQIDVDSLCLGIGYPYQGNQLWNINDVGTTKRTHWVLPITPEMKKIRIDAYSTHRIAYALVTAYSVPTNTTPCNFCNGFQSVYIIGKNGTTGWMDIPSDCKYVILIKNSGNDDFSPKTVTIIKDAPSNYEYLDEVKPSAFMQGGIANADGSDNTSPYRIRSEYFPVREGDVVYINYNNQRVRVIPYDINKVLLNGAYMNWYYEKTYICEADGYVRLSVAEYDDSTITPSAMRSVIRMRVNNDIVQLNDNLIDSIANLKRPPRVGYTTQGEVLSLLHFSDIHIDRPFELRRIIQIGNSFEDYIDDIISTGDIQDRGWESGIADFTDTDGAEKILQVIGNHDAYVSNKWTFTTAINVYNRFIAPFVSNWGVTQPSGASTNGYNYWYKDYASQKVRLIALDCIYWDAIQKTWLDGILANTPSEYSIVCASHYRPRMNDILCNMDDLIYQPSTMNEYTSDEAVNAVQAYINNGGKFICWLCGHEHKDYVGLTSVSNTNQLVIGVACASQNEARARYGVIARLEGEKSQDLFNIIGFDTYNKLIRILRVGADSDTFMRSKKTLCINYETHDIIAQF